MSYSYECNVICDECRDVISGEVCERAFAAEMSANEVAKAKGWTNEFEDKWICADCQRGPQENQETGTDIGDYQQQL